MYIYTVYVQLTWSTSIEWAAMVIACKPEEQNLDIVTPKLWWCLLKKDYNKGVTKSNPTQKCRPAKGISKRVNIQIIKDTDITEQPNNKLPKHSTHEKNKERPNL